MITCPLNEGSVSASVYPVMPVEKTTSPFTGFSAPNDVPTNDEPSSNVKVALTLLTGSLPLFVFTILQFSGLGGRKLNFLKSFENLLNIEIDRNRFIFESVMTI